MNIDYNRMFSQRGRIPCHHLLPPPQVLPLAAGAAPPAAGAAPTPDPILVISSFRSQLSRALAKRPGQYGSNSTPAALRMVEIFSGVTATSSSARMRAA